MKLLTIICVIQALGLARLILGQTNTTQDEAIEIAPPLPEEKVVHGQNSTEGAVSDEDYPYSVSPPYCDPYVEYCGGHDYEPYN